MNRALRFPGTVEQMMVTPARVRLPVATMAVYSLLPLVALAVVGPMFGAALGPVDDHHVPYIGAMLAERGFLATVLPWMGEQDGRFRPLYWPLYFGEIALWGPNVAGYYLDRLLLTLATLVAGYAALRLWFPVAASVVGSALILAGPQAAAFWMLGSQEAWAVPLSLGAIALVAHRRFAGGLALAVLAAYIKEPFILTGLLTVAWAWRLGARRTALLGGALIVVAGVAFAASMVLYGAFYAGGTPLAARYLYPAVFVIGFVAAWLATRSRVALVGAALFVVVGTVGASREARDWTIGTQRWQAGIAELARVMASNPGPVIVSGPMEPATIALPAYLPAVERGGSGACIGVTMFEYPEPDCPVIVRF